MSDGPTTQQSRIRPQNPYNQHPRTDIQNDTPAPSRRRSKRLPPQKTTLYDWIKPNLPNTLAPNPNTTNNCNNHCNAVTATTNKPGNTRRQSHQQQLYPTHINDQWGDDLSSSPTTFRIASKNVNTLSPGDNLIQWRGVANAMRDYQIHSLSIQETNTKWTKHLQQCVHRVFQTTFLRAAISTSNSTEPSGTYQPGGTALTIVGPHASRLLSSGQDPSGMGRWSYIELLGKHNKRLILASVYCVRSQTAHIGSNTVSTQQTQILLQSGQHHPRPRKQLINDLIHQIQQWQLTGHEILVCLDANEDTANPNPESGYGKILHATGLIDLHRYLHPNTPTPATHNRGSLTIDACIGTKLFIDALTGAWILPFGLPSTIPGDHRMLGIDFDQDILFGNKLPLPSIPSARGVYSNDQTAVREFNDRVTEECEASQLFN